MDFKDAYAYIFATDYVYNVHWNLGIDFSHNLVFPSYLSEDTDKTIILRYNYTENREVYDVFKMVGK